MRKLLKKVCDQIDLFMQMGYWPRVSELKAEIEAELAKPEPEPVAEIIRHFNNGNFTHVSVKFLTNPDLIIHGAKLYTHPPAADIIEGIKPKRKKKWPKYDKHLFIPIYHGEVYLFKEQSKFFDAVEYLGGKRDDGNYNGNAVHFENEKGNSVYLIGWYNDQLSTLVHEICHVGIFLMHHVGIDPKSDGGEAMCYLNGYLFEQLSK